MDDPAEAIEPLIHISGPGGLVACVPYLIGFEPRQSLVAVFMSSPPRRVVLTMRVDLPGQDQHSTSQELCRQLAAAVRRARGADVDIDLVHLLVFDASAQDRGLASGGAGPSAAERTSFAVIEGVGRVLAAMAVEIGERLLCGADRWWRLDCPDDGCCPGPGHPIQSDDELAATFALVSSGVGHVRDRAVLEQAVLPVAHRQLRQDAFAAAQALRATAERRRDRGRAWRRGCEDELVACMCSEEGGSSSASSRVGQVHSSAGAQTASARDVEVRLAELTLALADSRVREPVMHRILVGRSARRQRAALEGARRLLTYFVTRLDGPPCAPVAATLAMLSWQQGDGAYARIAAERALDCEPGNRLASLVWAACGSGLPPAQWRTVLAAFHLSDLRGEISGAAGSTMPEAG